MRGGKKPGFVHRLCLFGRAVFKRLQPGEPVIFRIKAMGRKPGNGSKQDIVSCNPGALGLRGCSAVGACGYLGHYRNLHQGGRRESLQAARCQRRNQEGGKRVRGRAPAPRRPSLVGQGKIVVG